MTERYTATAFDLLPAERFSDVLIANISRNREEIADLKAGRDLIIPAVVSEQIRTLHKKVDRDLISLLTLRSITNLTDEYDDMPEDEEESPEEKTPLEREIRAEVEIFPGEKIHPFSSNRVVIGVPSPKYPGRQYSIFTFLSDLRGEGVYNSLDAFELLGDNFEAARMENDNLLWKTKRELARIDVERTRVIEGRSRYSLGYLNQITRDIETRRQLVASR